MLSYKTSCRLGRLALIGTILAASPAFADGCTCVGDVNNDNVVDGADLGQLLSVWGTDTSWGDLDQNDVVNGGDLGLLLAAWGPCPGIVNDNCANAIDVVPGIYPFCTIGATTDGPALPQGGCFINQVHRDIWYRFTATSTGSVTISTCSETYFDTAVAVYGSILPGNSPCPSDGVGLATFVGCNDDAPNNCVIFGGSRLTFNVNAGHVYRIRVGGFFDGNAGAGTLTINYAHPGESCVNPHVTSPTQMFHTIVGNTQDNEVADIPANCLGLDVERGPTEWVRWTAPCNGIVEVSTCNPGTNFDTLLTMLRQESDGNCWSTYLTCNDDSPLPGCDLGGTTYKSYMVRTVTAGEVLYFVVSGYDGAAGNFELTINMSCN